MSETPQPQYVLCVWVPALERYTPALGCPPQYDVRAARLQERERCAKVAEGFAADLADGLGDPETALEIAAAIRALPEGE